MATQKAVKWRFDIGGARTPHTILDKFQAGSTQEIDDGELLERTGDTNTAWVPMDSDFAMAGNVAVSIGKIKSGDAEGMYEVIIPRPTDVFEAKLLSTDDQNPARGTAVYWSDSETVTTTAGSNILGYIYDHDGYPQQSGHASDDASVARGVTIGNCGGKVLFTIKEKNSYHNTLFGDDA